MCVLMVWRTRHASDDRFASHPRGISSHPSTDIEGQSGGMSLKTSGEGRTEGEEKVEGRENDSLRERNSRSNLNQ